MLSTVFAIFFSILSAMPHRFFLPPLRRRFAVPIAVAVAIAKALDMERPFFFSASAILSRFFLRAGVSFFAI
jgi:hypothetical protein